MAGKRPNETAAWAALAAHHAAIKDRHLRELFAGDPERAEQFSVEGAGLFLDYSKNRITAETMRLLLRPRTRARRGGDGGTRCSRGEKINETERRAVLHVALRAPRGARIEVDGQDVVPEVHAVLDRMAEFARAVRDGRWKGHSGKRIRNVVNVGIGGSYLGPEMACRALRDIQRQDDDVPLRLQRRWRELHRGDPRASIRRRRCSSSRPRPSPRSRR